VAPYRDLRTWRLARQLALETGQAVKNFPVAGRIAVGDQLVRATVSVLLNITEGSSRRGARELRRYLDIARASLEESQTALELACDLGYLDGHTGARLQALSRDTGRTLWGLLRSIKSRAK
jgi:four helix bundle protein